MRRRIFCQIARILRRQSPVKGNLCDMTENMQAYADKVRRAVIVRCCLKSVCFTFYTKTGIQPLEKPLFSAKTECGKAADSFFASFLGSKKEVGNGAKPRIHRHGNQKEESKKTAKCRTFSTDRFPVLYKNGNFYFQQTQ